jgi:hypothetical protein
VGHRPDRVSREEELREHDEVRAGGGLLREDVAGSPHILVDVPEHGVDLG